MSTFLAAGVVVLLVSGGCFSGIINTSQSTMLGISEQRNIDTQDKVFITSYIGGIPRTQSLSYESCVHFQEVFSALVQANAENPCCESTRMLKVQFIELLADLGLVSSHLSVEDVVSMIEPPWVHSMLSHQGSHLMSPRSSEDDNNATLWLCSMAGAGYGFILPPFLLPRPRLVMQWRGFYPESSAVSVAEMATGRGVIARGTQVGTTFGFIGVGFAFAFPGAPAQFGFIGYSLLTKLQGADMTWYYANFPPLVMDMSPEDGAVNVPTSLSELSFTLKDYDFDTMTYNVVTSPDIGSGADANAGNGAYHVPVSGLDGGTTYTWTVTVSDGTDTVENTFTFTTEMVAPVISNPTPVDGERDVPMDIQELRFTLHDFQSDAMDYTVQTQPDIGSAQGTDVHNGTYTVPISGMTYAATYQWYVNVTDGTHWTRKIFSFETGYPTHFNPFDFGWQYRKQISIDHSQVAGNLDSFPVFIHMIDSDLQAKAQPDGGDILFMNGSGVATKLSHGELISWVNISLAAGEDTVLYMYYGNPNSTNAQAPTRVWDPSFVGVWHLNDFQDSTNNGNHGSNYGSIPISGKLGDARCFDGADDYILVENDPSLNFQTPNKFSISFWMKRDRLNTYESIISKGTTAYLAGYGVQIRENNTILLVLYDGSHEHLFTSNQVIVDTNWHYITAVWDGTTRYIYIDGALDRSDNIGAVTVADDSKPLEFGHHYGYINGQNPYAGSIDEIQISKKNRNSDWIATSFLNQQNPSGFYNVGPEEPEP